MFWIWVRGGPSAVVALVVVMAAFVGLFWFTASIAVWLPPFVIIPVGITVLILARRRPGRADDD
jgi:hypothetical protein